MGVATLARDDFDNVRRSHVVLGVVGVFSALVGLVFLSEVDIYPDAYRTLYDVSALIAFAFPLFAAALSYLAVAGDRGRGTIKYVLGLPNSRAEYFVAKYVSRATVAVGAILVGTLVGFAVAAVAFENSPDPVRFLTFGLLSSLYALAIVGLFVALSAMTAERSRAMFAVLGAYFLLVPFWSGLLPVVSLQTLVDTAVAALGVELSDATRHLIAVLSPTQAYFASTELVYTGIGEAYPVFDAIGGPAEYLADEEWFAVFVMLGWATVAPLVGYLRFRVAELG